MSLFAQVATNTQGRDFAVGDIHGHFSRLQQALDRIGFNPVVDRLFSVGDLVDRGPQSEQSLEWLNRPWFFAVQGNHEALAMQLYAGQKLDLDMYRNSGGAWFLDASREKQRLYAGRFSEMPIAIEVMTAEGPVGLLHADCPFTRWGQVRNYLGGQFPRERRTDEIFQWSRSRLKRNDTRGIDEVRAVIVGHTPLRVPKCLGNVFHIDTAGWSEGYFSFVDLATLEVLDRDPRGSSQGKA